MSLDTLTPGSAVNRNPGDVVAIARRKASHTGRFLKAHLAASAGART